MIKGKPVTGGIYLNLVRQYLEAMNSGKVPQILTSLQRVLQSQARSISQQILQMKQVEETKILKDKDNLSFIISQFDEDNNQTKIEKQKQQKQKQCQFRDNLFEGSINQNSIIFRPSDSDQQQQFEDNQLSNDQYDSIDNQEWYPCIINDYQQQRLMQSQQKVFIEASKTLPLSLEEFVQKYKYSKILKKTSTIQDSQWLFQKKIKKLPSNFQSLKKNIEKPKINKQFDFQ